MTLPRDFLSEVELELQQARTRLAHDHERLTALRELHAVAASVASHLNREITVFDVIRSSLERTERERRAQLVRHMRTPISHE